MVEEADTQANVEMLMLYALAAVVRCAIVATGKF
jgi:hypothetical protein